jgi:hypothetical protein
MNYIKIINQQIEVVPKTCFMHSMKNILLTLLKVLVSQIRMLFWLCLVKHHAHQYLKLTEINLVAVLQGALRWTMI